MPYFLFVWNICFCPCLNKKGAELRGWRGLAQCYHHAKGRARREKVQNFWFAFVFSYLMNRNTWSWKKVLLRLEQFVAVIPML